MNIYALQSKSILVSKKELQKVPLSNLLMWSIQSAVATVIICLLNSSLFGFMFMLTMIFYGVANVAFTMTLSNMITDSKLTSQIGSIFGLSALALFYQIMSQPNP